MGLLVQPHTSAGRVPSSLGFRFYVDSLMTKYQMTANEIAQLRGVMLHKFNELGKNYTRCFSCIFYGDQPADLRHPAQAGTRRHPKHQGGGCGYAHHHGDVADRAGVIKNKLLRLRAGVSDPFIERLNEILNENLAGMTRSEIQLDNIMQIKNAVGENLEILSSVLELVYEAIYRAG